ncbi:hypothetical protein ACQKWADRAFT_309274 [Trichoderma austrokoningii]
MGPDAFARALAYEGFQHSRNNEPGDSQADSDWHQVILHVNGDLLPGFDIDHIRSMATDDSPGLRVQVLAHPGTFSTPFVLMKLQIKCGETWHLLALISAPFGETGHPLLAQRFEVEDTPAMRTLFTIPSTYISSSTVMDPANGLDSELMGLGLSDPQHDGAPSRCSTFVRPETESAQIITITVGAIANSKMVAFSPLFWRQIHRQPLATRAIAERIKSMLSATGPGSLITFWITFPFYKQWRQDWRLFFGDEHKENPYGRVAWEKRQADNTPNKPFRSLLIPFPGSEWTAAEDDKQEYGTDATGLPTAYLMAVNMKTVPNAMPDIGAFVEIELSVFKGLFLLPKQPQTPQHIRKIAVEIQGILKAAEDEAKGASEGAQIRTGRIPGKEPTSENFVRLYAEVYANTAAKGLMPYINKLSNKAKARFSSGPEDSQRRMDAVIAASQLRLRIGEKDNAHVKRIAKWFKAQGVVVRNSEPREFDPPFLGCRLDPPRDIPTEVALFHLQVPKQPDWPHGFKHPPLRIIFPCVIPIAESPVGKNKYTAEDFFYARKAVAFEAQCNEIRVVDSVQLDHKESDQLEATLRKIAMKVTKTD